MKFWVYLLRCTDGSLYTGHTDNLERRLAEHESGVRGGYTSERRPVVAIWAQEFPTREEALTREIQIKRWSRAKKEALAREEWSSLKRLARGPNRKPAQPSR